MDLRKNKLVLLLIIGLLAIKTKTEAQLLKTASASISFFSSTPIEDIQATSTKCIAIINTSNQELGFQVPIKTFVFERALMQEHFNENYMESDKYPFATFKGKLTSPVNWSKDGIYLVEVKGMLTIHNITKERIIKGTINIHNKTVDLSADFDVACKDYEIQVPILVFKKIAEIVQVKVKTSFNQ